MTGDDVIELSAEAFERHKQGTHRVITRLSCDIGNLLKRSDVINSAAVSSAAIDAKR